LNHIGTASPPQCATFNSQQVEDDGFASDFADGGTPQNSKPFGGFCIGVDKVTKVWINLFYPQKD